MQISLAQVFIATLWPSFMVAIAATGLFFSAFDPQDLYPFDLDIDISTMGAYTIGFFVFWILGAASSGITVYFTVTNYKAVALNDSSLRKN
ncbi:MAG: hypothetical protein GY806_18605 [Gammaproteobacteria bacterium]|nr:hypothetical protein [Gammaproteobacteria bacterium]